jgi:hypothetical protein
MGINLGPPLKNCIHEDSLTISDKKAAEIQSKNRIITVFFLLLFPIITSSDSIINGKKMVIKTSLTVNTAKIRIVAQEKTPIKKAKYFLFNVNIYLILFNSNCLSPVFKLNDAKNKLLYLNIILVL